MMQTTSLGEHPQPFQRPPVVLTHQNQPEVFDEITQIVEFDDHEPSPSPKLSQKEEIDDLNETQTFDEKPPPYHPSPQYYTQPHHFSNHQPHHYYHHQFPQMMPQSPAYPFNLPFMPQSHLHNPISLPKPAHNAVFVGLNPIKSLIEFETSQIKYHNWCNKVHNQLDTYELLEYVKSAVPEPALSGQVSNQKYVYSYLLNCCSKVTQAYNWVKVPQFKQRPDLVMLALNEEYAKVIKIELSAYKKKLYNEKTKTSSQSVSNFSTKIKRIVNNLTDNGETVTESTLKWILYEELPEYQSQLMEKYCDEAVPYSAFLNYVVTLEKVVIRNKKKEHSFAHSATEQPVSTWKTYKVGETHPDRSLVTNMHCMWCGILKHSMTKKGKTVCKAKIARKPQTELGKSFKNIKKLSDKVMLLSKFPALSMNEFSFALLDSGAFPNIMMNDSCVHDNIHPSSSFVYTATGEKVPTKLEENSVIETDGNSLEIGQTKILEKIPYNLLFVGVICDQLDTTIVFDKDSAKILSDSVEFSTE